MPFSVSEMVLKLGQEGPQRMFLLLFTCQPTAGGKPNSSKSGKALFPHKMTKNLKPFVGQAASTGALCEGQLDS